MKYLKLLLMIGLLPVFASAETSVRGDATNINFDTTINKVYSITVAGSNTAFEVKDLHFAPETPLLDGHYNYEVKSVTGAKTVVDSSQSDGRDSIVVKNNIIDVVEFGTFMIKNGQVINPAVEQE